MDFNVLKAKGFNKLFLFLIAVQLSILLGIAILLILSLVSDILSVMTVVSFVLLLLLCLPLSLMLYKSSPDKDLRSIYLALLALYTLLSISGILWYILPLTANAPWLVILAKATMVASYAPVLYVLSGLLKAQVRQIEPYLKTFVLFINATSSLVILYFTLAYLARSSSLFDAAVYAMSTIADIAVLTMCALLALVYMQNQLRYILAIIFVLYTFSLVGDSLNLLGILDLYDTIGHAQFFYDVMLISNALLLLIYSFASVKVTTVEEVNKKLYDARNLMDDLIMQSPGAICIFDADGAAIAANQGFFKLMNGSQPDVIGKLNLFHDADRLIEGAGVAVSRARQGETVVFDDVKLQLAKKDQATYHYIKVFPTYGSDGAITYFIAIIEDITAQKRYEDELLQAKLQAELYLDVMGHDINNMNQIGIGFLELAQERLRLDENEQVLLQKPLEAMRNSSHLINNVKKIRYASAGSLGYEPIDVDRVLREVIRDYAEVPGRDVTIEHTPVTGCYVMANLLLKDIFVNLLSNAIRHSEGPLTIRAGVVPSWVDGAACCRVTIEDDGPGIPDEVKRAIFDRVYRNRTSGSGLGLYLVKALVDGFHGTIAVEDRVPGDRRAGTRFIVTLPASDHYRQNDAGGAGEKPPASA